MANVLIPVVGLLSRTLKTRGRHVFASLRLCQSLFSLISITILVLFVVPGKSYGMPINGNVLNICPVLREVIFSVTKTGSLYPKYRESLLACLNLPKQEVDGEVVTALVAYIAGEASNVDEELWSVLSERVKNDSHLLSDAFYRMAYIKRQTSNPEKRTAQFEEALQSKNPYLVVEAAKELLKSKKELGIASLLELKDLARNKDARSAELAKVADISEEIEVRDRFNFILNIETEVIQCLADAGKDVKQRPPTFIGKNPYDLVMWVVRGREVERFVNSNASKSVIESFRPFLQRVREAKSPSDDDVKQMLDWINKRASVCSDASLVLYIETRGDTPEVRQSLGEAIEWGIKHPESFDSALFSLGRIKNSLHGKSDAGKMQELLPLLSSQNPYLKIEVAKLIYGIDPVQGKKILGEIAASDDSIDWACILKGEAGRLLWNMGEELEPGLAFSHMFITRYLDYLAMVEGEPLWKYVKKASTK